jgi:membrane dipeptidase
MKKITVFIFPILWIFISCNAENGAKQISDEDALKHVKQLLRNSPLIDSHNDVPWTIRNRSEAPRDIVAFDLRQNLDGDTDIPRLREGMVGAQFWSVFIPGEYGDYGYAKLQLEQIDIARRMIERYSKDLSLALTVDDIENIFNEGKIASLIGIEGGHAIENSLGALRSFYMLGARYMTLTHNVTLDWADAAMDEPKHHGLTDFGIEVIREMNRLGMLVDLSHVTPKVMSDVLDVSESPIIFSHSNARALTDHARNVPDSILVRLQDNGGVVMLSFIPFFVSQECADWLEEKDKTIKGASTPDEFESLFTGMPKATIEHVIKHIEHVKNIAGIDHIGIGSDYGINYGSDFMPVGLEDVSKYPYLFVELIKNGWTDGDLKKIAGGNIMRVMRENENNANRIQKLRHPSTIAIEDLQSEN